MKLIQTARHYDLPISNVQKRNAIGNKCIGYITMHPMDFLELTTTNKEGVERIMNDSQPLEVYLKSIRNRSNLVMPFLGIEVAKGKLGKAKRGEVVGHEGRHRAAALLKSGKTRLPVAVRVREEGREWKYYAERYVPNEGREKVFMNASIIPEVWTGQFNSSISKNMSNALKTFESFYSSSATKDIQDVRDW